VFHDLKLMEREGSGYDRMYEVLLSQGKPVPEPKEGPDRFEVTVRPRIIKPQVIDFLAKADQTFQLTQRERIALGLLAQQEGLTARELTNLLELASVNALSPWIQRLLTLGLVKSRGRTQATCYFVDPDLLRRLDFTARTSLKRIEPHRLAALIVEDVERYPNSRIGAIHERIGAEIPRVQLKRALAALVREGRLMMSGFRGGATYRVPDWTWITLGFI
jgi:ATP-dependent DNA helicase RecG